MNRPIRIIERPTPGQTLAASCGMTPNLPIGHEVQLWHHGEDGPTLELHDLRGPVFIDWDHNFGELEPAFQPDIWDLVDDDSPCGISDPQPT
jgi:hypothetical protein